MELEKGKVFEYQGNEFKIKDVTESKMIIAECMAKGVVPAVQPFRLDEQGNIKRL